MTTLADILSMIDAHEKGIAALRHQAHEIRSQERAVVLDEMRKLVAQHGLTGVDLGFSARRDMKRNQVASNNRKRQTKYKGPEGQIWHGGRGPKPRWIAEAIIAGVPLSDFEIM